MGLVLWLPQLAILVTGPFSDLSRSLLQIISFHSLGKGQSRGRCKQYDLGTLPNADVRYGSEAEVVAHHRVGPLGANIGHWLGWD